MPASNNIFKNIRYFDKGGETTPFLFKGKEYYLLNISPRCCNEHLLSRNNAMYAGCFNTI